MSFFRNTAGQGLGFSLISTSTGGAVTGATVTVYRTIDNATQGAATGTVTEKGNGQYWFALSQADTNGAEISLLFLATGAIPVEKTIVTSILVPGQGGGGGGGGSSSGKTVISGITGYCTAQDLLDRYDWRSIADLLADDSTAARLTQSQVLASTAVTKYIMEESGKVESTCLAGGRYTIADLAALQSPIMTNGGEMLAGLVVDLVMWRIWRRRPRQERDAPVNVKDTRDTLTALGKGEAIFGFQEVADAGRLEHQLISDDDVTLRNDRTVIAERYFGRRADRDGRNPSP